MVVFPRAIYTSSWKEQLLRGSAHTHTALYSTIPASSESSVASQMKFAFLPQFCHIFSVKRWGQNYWESLQMQESSWLWVCCGGAVDTQLVNNRKAGVSTPDTSWNLWRLSVGFTGSVSMECTKVNIALFFFPYSLKLSLFVHQNSLWNLKSTGKLSCPSPAYFACGCSTDWGLWEVTIRRTMDKGGNWRYQLTPVNHNLNSFLFHN